MFEYAAPARNWRRRPFRLDCSCTKIENLEKIDDRIDTPVYEKRPWGSFTVIDEGSYLKVKRIEVLPEKRLSYQRHSRRAEHWFVVNGIAKVTLNDAEILVKAGNR